MLGIVRELKTTAVTWPVARQAKNRKRCTTFFPKDFLLMIDESHVTVSQIRAMYAGDRSRKETLVAHGFRLPSALDNRPLKFEEWENRINQVVYVSATPNDYELEKTQGEVVEQIIRPTGLLDPVVEVVPASGQIAHLLGEIKERQAVGRTGVGDRADQTAGRGLVGLPVRKRGRLQMAA